MTRVGVYRDKVCLTSQFAIDREIGIVRVPQAESDPVGIWSFLIARGGLRSIAVLTRAVFLRTGSVRPPEALSAPQARMKSPALRMMWPWSSIWKSAAGFLFVLAETIVSPPEN